MTTKPKLIVPKHIWDGKAAAKAKSELESARISTINNFSEKEIVKQTLKIYDSLNSNQNRSYLLIKDKKNQKSWLPK